MGMVVQHNMNAINSYNKLNANVAGMKKSSEKLSSGYRINRAGDDAAGLAVSEKMRSQIKGLNQAIRNSQDGINMIQTYEGAAQESHSILQRMKELATQSANGTYDNATDRAAIQLEFDQLNDELNQIADTDFNGTVVLNGGEMADGLKQIGNEFNYANKKDQLTAKVTDMLDKTIADATKALSDAQKALDSNKYDLSSKGAAPQWNNVDNSMYDKTAADALWQKLTLTEDGTDTGDVDVKKGTTVDVTFEYDKTNKTWTAKKGTINGGNAEDVALTDDQLKAFTTTTKDNTTVTGANGNGGFEVAITGGATLANAIYSATEAKDGDTVTLTFTNAAKTQFAPNNIGFNADTVKVDSTGTVDLGEPAVKLSGVKDGEMTQEIYDAFKAVEDAKFEATYDGTATLKSATLGGVNLTFSTGGSTVNIGGKQFTVTADSATKPTSLKFTAGGKDLFEITIDEAAANVEGTASGNISISEYKFSDPTGSVTVKPGDDPALESSTELTAARDAAQAALDAANAKKAEVLSGDEKQWDNVKAYYGTAKGVSIADSFDNSTAIMSYAENITLQTGARTKDSVNFTFNYNADKTADMGELKANLNISAREDGLNTENLSLATQDDANLAIDQIDKAINKVSMVRASFGSIQNRLEHKITNLTTTSENLTEAESSIRDTDMASEMMNYTKFNILQQAAQSMLAQANQQPQSILQLLG